MQESISRREVECQFVTFTSSCVVVLRRNVRQESERVGVGVVEQLRQQVLGIAHELRGRLRQHSFPVVRGQRDERAVVKREQLNHAVIVRVECAVGVEHEHAIVVHQQSERLEKTIVVVRDQHVVFVDRQFQRPDRFEHTVVACEHDEADGVQGARDVRALRTPERARTLRSSTRVPRSLRSPTGPGGPQLDRAVRTQPGYVHAHQPGTFHLEQFVSRRLWQDFPIKMPQRHDNRKDYACDPPLSEFGQLTGQIVGRELRLQGADIRRVFSSSALSCVQTAVAIIKGYRYVFAFTV